MLYIHSSFILFDWQKNNFQSKNKQEANTKSSCLMPLLSLKHHVVKRPFITHDSYFLSRMSDQLINPLPKTCVPREEIKRINFIEWNGFWVSSVTNKLINFKESITFNTSSISRSLLSKIFYITNLIRQKGKTKKLFQPFSKNL